MQYDIFISYRRDGGEYTAKILRDQLEEKGYRVFFDVESLRSGDFNTRLYTVIDECKDFLLVLSPNALDRCVHQDDWVRCEIEHALQKDKNIIPVMLRGFSFPQTLPDSIAPLRYKNGLEANTQFFDAFLKKLQQFLISKPPLVRRVSQNSLFRKTLPVLIAFLIVVGLGLGAYQMLNARNQSFPRTAAEKSVTSEVIYYTENHLMRLDLMAGAVDSALTAAQRYLASGSIEETELQDVFDRAYHTIQACELDACAPADGFIERVNSLTGAPFPAAELIAMHDALVLYQEEWLGSLAFIQWAVAPDSFLSSSSRLGILDSYQVFLEETLKEHAYLCNELLVPITNQSELSEFLNIYLPTLTRVPLSATSWSMDVDALEAAVNACLNREQEALINLNAIVGNMNVQNQSLRESMIRSYMSIGMSREEAERYVDEEFQFQEVDQELLPAEGDDEDVLWEKMAHLIGGGYYDEAMDCVETLEQLVGQTDPYADEYIPALRDFVTIASLTDIDYGVMVVGWADPDVPNEVYKIGDIIVFIDSQTCHTYEEYRAAKDALTDSAYQVIVLRANGSGVPESVILDLNTDMPQVYLRTLSDYGYY